MPKPKILDPVLKELDFINHNKNGLTRILKIFLQNSYEHESMYKYKINPTGKGLPLNGGTVENIFMQYLWLYPKMGYDGNNRTWDLEGFTDCNEILSSTFFNQVYKETVASNNPIYLIAQCHPNMHARMLEALNYYMKLLFKEKYEPIKQVPILYDKTTLQYGVAHVTYGKEGWFSPDKYDVKYWKDLINKVQGQFISSKDIIQSDDNDYDYQMGFSKETCIELVLKSSLVLEIPHIYAHSTLSIFAIGIVLKIANFLDSTVPLEKALESLSEMKLAYLSRRVEAIRRWVNMEKVILKLSKSNFIDVFPPYTQTKLNCNGFDSVHSSINRARRLTRYLSLDKDEMSTTEVETVSEVIKIGKYININYLRLFLGPKGSEDLAMLYAKFSEKCMKQRGYILESLAKKPKTAKVVA